MFTEQLPIGSTKTWNFCEEAPAREGSLEVNFKLVYQGQLRATSGSETRVREKHAIRKVLHKQLKELWQVQEPYAHYLKVVIPAHTQPANFAKDTKVVDIWADQFARCGYRFLPAIRQKSLSCSLDILFLRRDHPGNLVASGGDIDNRIKTLFDSLRMPSNCGELAGIPPDADENPFHVLLEDDSQITKVSVATERLLTPPTTGEHIHDVHLIIGVTVNVLELPQGWGSLSFLGS